jgi:feruloyl esterase
MKEPCFPHSSPTPYGWPSQTCKYLAASAMWALSLSTTTLSQQTASAVSCQSLAKLTLPDTTITMAQPVAAGEFKPPASFHALPGQVFPPTPAFCCVTATVKPTSDSNIRIEVWLPLSGWNGNFLGVGGTGWSGYIGYGGLISEVALGYAVGSADAGHDRSKEEEVGGRFALGHPERLIDYGYRAVHSMTVDGKEITKAFYGSAARHSYFFGASRGGYEEIAVARRFPEDYDAICAAWPPNPLVLSYAQQLWADWLIAKDPARFIPKDKYSMIHKAVLKECDELDGVEDGVINEPNRCHFDPKVLQCKGADSPDCLTAPQVELLRKTYEGPVNPRTGKVIVPGPAPGAEEQMYSFAIGEPQQAPLDLFKYVVFHDPNWDWKTLNWDSDIDKAIKNTSPTLITDSNLSGFVDHGGKLLFYTGWINYQNPTDLINYYNDVVTTVGASKAAKSIRLVIMPGNPQDPVFNRVDVIEQWTEKGEAPDQITATYHIDSKVRTRPLCAYPKVAQYKGTSSTDAAQNFVCLPSEFAQKQ